MDEHPDEADFDEWMRYAGREDTPEASRRGPIRPFHLAVAAAVGAVFTLVGMVLLWPSSGFRDQGSDEITSLVATEVYAAEVTGVTEGPCVDCIDVTFLLTAGPDEGTTSVQTFSLSPATEFDVGDSVVLGLIPDAQPEFRYQFLDRQRRGVLWVVALAFAAAVVALGRMRGLTALAGLAVSLVILLVFVLPAIVDGRPPVLVAVVGAAAIAYVALYLAHGFTAMTTVALLGTLGALALTAALSGITVAAAELTGFASEESTYLQLFATELDFQGLVLAGIVLGSLGALDDVTVTQASAVSELRRTDPNLGAGGLMRSGLRIGRDHIASTVNTLLLAYAGAALPLLVLFVLSRQSLGTIANSEAVATEIIRTLVGSIGLVTSVPITTWLAAYVAD